MCKCNIYRLDYTNMGAFKRTQTTISEGKTCLSSFSFLRTSKVSLMREYFVNYWCKTVAFGVVLPLITFSSINYIVMRHLKVAKEIICFIYFTILLNYKWLDWIFFPIYIPSNLPAITASSHTVQVKLRANRGHFYYSTKTTRFSESSPHFGCKLNVSLGLESWVGGLPENQYAAFVPLHQPCNCTYTFWGHWK